MLFDVKHKIEGKIKPVARHIPLSPNSITVLSIISMLIGGYFVITNSLIYAACLVFLSGFLDIMDGVVAKARNKVTRFGNFFDKFADRVNDAVILSSIIVANMVNIYLGVFVLCVIVLGSYASAVIESLTKTNIGSVMSMRGIRILIITIGIALNQIFIMMCVLAFLGIAALIERISNAKKYLKD